MCHVGVLVSIGESHAGICNKSLRESKEVHGMMHGIFVLNIPLCKAI